MPTSFQSRDANVQAIRPAGAEGQIDVLRYADCDRSALGSVLSGYGLVVEEIAGSLAVPGSYWGEEEAGLIENRIYVRADTPVHSVLHEACHFICMDPQRRTDLHTNAGGDYEEENAVCYLQITLAAHLAELGITGMWRDMDKWGYTFRLGSAQAWYEQDAADALAWLVTSGILNEDGQPSGRIRMAGPV